MSRPRHKPRPPGNVLICCTGRGAQNPVRIRTLQLIVGETGVRLVWNQREGAPPVTGRRDETGMHTYELRCGTCRPRRHLKIGEEKLAKAAMALDEYHGIRGDDNTPIPLDISALEAAL